MAVVVFRVLRQTRPGMITQAAHLYATLCIATIFFQVALIGGAPWGAATQGGQRSGPLTWKGRLFAALSVPILGFQALAILSAAGFAGGFWPIWTGWTALGVTVATTVLNWITPSRIERMIWAPVTTLMLALGAFVMTGAI